MDRESFTTEMPSSASRSSRRRFMLGLMGVAVTAALGESAAEAKPHHTKKHKGRRKHRRKHKPP
jgi:hypothetical protein